MSENNKLFENNKLIENNKLFENKYKSQEKEGLYKKKHRRFMGVTMLAVTPQTIPQLKQKIGLPKNLQHGIVVYQVVQV